MTQTVIILQTHVIENPCHCKLITKIQLTTKSFVIGQYKLNRSLSCQILKIAINGNYGETTNYHGEWTHSRWRMDLLFNGEWTRSNQWRIGFMAKQPVPPIKEPE